MDSSESPLPVPPSEDLTPGGSERALFSGTSLAVWLASALAVGVLMGGCAAMAETLFAPLLLFPLLVGAVLGGLLFGLMRLEQVAHRWTVIAGVLLAAATVSVTQHYVSYLQARRMQPPQARMAGIDFLPTSSFANYLAREAAVGRRLFGDFQLHGVGVWLSWGLDALLIAGAALAMVVPALGLPYCTDCQTWYRTTRTGRLAREEARALAAIFGVELPERIPFVRYRVLTCGSGCGTTGLELSWREPRHDVSCMRYWLEPLRRAEVQGVLDQVANAHRVRRRLRRSRETGTT